MKIEKINIKNFKGIGSYEGDINGANVYLTGGNEAGKTSFIDAVWCGISGTKNLPTEPVQKGQKKGQIEIDLGDFIARTKFTRGKAVVFELENKIFSSESERFIKSPRTYLNNRIGVIDFNIYEFFSKTDSEKLAYLAKMLDNDFSSLDADIDEVMESRKFDKKRLGILNGTASFYDIKDAEAKPIDIVELGKEIATEEKKVETFERIQKGIEGRTARVQELEAEIESLKKQVNDAIIWANQSEVIPDLSKIELLNKKLETANETNKKISEAKTAHLIDIEVDELTKSIADQDDELERLRLEKSKKISESLNVDGLSYDVENEIFLYKGLPFEKNQNNTASHLIAGMHIAQSLLKELKIVRVDASLIDKKNFNEVLKWAKENNIELFVELVDREATKLEIKIGEDE